MDHQTVRAIVGKMDRGSIGCLGGAAAVEEIIEIGMLKAVARITRVTARIIAVEATDIIEIGMPKEVATST